MPRIIILLLLSFFSLSVNSQLLNLAVNDSLTNVELDSLKSTFGFGKTVPEEYALSFYTALSYYPELDSSVITLKKVRIKTTLNARPTNTSLIFRKRTKRKYVIRINSRNQDSLILLDDVPFNARIGLFGHELTHFIDYHHKSFGGVLKRMFSYSTLKGKEKYEKEIDSMTVSIGLGQQLYTWSYYVLYKSKGSKKYKAYKKLVYLEPEEILKLIEEHETSN
ncbi:MAG: hypothetical protein QNK78_04590 [Crocinitomicaceae bacterium]|tara:strand:+ start:6436 stop:7101 length:666 start_codon:yes stop_codon:yes gene_type:complete